MANLEEATRENDRLRAQWIEAENHRLRESLDVLAGYVDPAEAFLGPDGTRWSTLGALPADSPSHVAFADERQLAEARDACRLLERNNEFAINGHENRVSYIIGTGHTYTAVCKKGEPAPAELVAEVQSVLDEFTRVNRWHKRQQEIVRRRDRDGEMFLRLFVGPDGMTRVRFVEPGQVARPRNLEGDPSASFGVQTDPGDVETIHGYWVDGSFVDAGEIQHRKLGVDSNVKRGVPLFWPVRHNLLWAEKLLRNMATVSDIQTAIAMIRRHDRAAKSAVETFRTGSASATIAAGASTAYLKHYAPGTILDVPKSTEYDFPASGLDASRYVQVLSAILRSVASRLVFPEFMLSSDASNSNYSSTLVAEGPAVKMFERWQADMEVDDLEIIWKVVGAAVDSGRLSKDAVRCVAIHVGRPRVATRDHQEEALVNRIYHQLGIKSAQTIAGEIGLDHEQEQQNFRARRDPRAVLDHTQNSGKYRNFNG